MKNGRSSRQRLLVSTFCFLFIAHSVAAAQSQAGLRIQIVQGDRARNILEQVPPNPIIVRITDTGVGMDEQAAKRIFEPYFSTKATGTGLGLAIAKRNIELNGGSIEVTSRRGAGTTVTMTLPVAA